MREKRPEESHVEMTELVLPQHTNPLGTVFGGVILSWVDIAASIASQRHSEQVMVTASIDGMDFLAPIHLGWVVSIKASVNYVGNTSCEVGVLIDAENPLTQDFHHTAKAYVTMVALDKRGKPRKIPGLKIETKEEARRFEEAKVRRAQRLILKEKLKRELD